MSTHAYIAIKNEDGTITKIYNHFSGNFTNVGYKLYHFYKDVDKVKKLIDLGDISMLGQNPEPTEAVRRWGSDYRYNNEFKNSKFAKEYKTFYDSTIIEDVDYGKGTISYHRDGGEELRQRYLKSEQQFLKRLQDYDYGYVFKDGMWFGTGRCLNGAFVEDTPLMYINECVYEDVE
ncbi:hypothetical protein ES702_00982 [subsurface metagenome]